MIEKELDVLVNEWNYHYISKNKYCETISGIPKILYFFTRTIWHVFYMFQVIINLKLKLGNSDYKCIIDYALLQYAEKNYENKQSLISDELSIQRSLSLMKVLYTKKSC